MSTSENLNLAATSTQKKRGRRGRPSTNPLNQRNGSTSSTTSSTSTMTSNRIVEEDIDRIIKEYIPPDEVDSNQSLCSICGKRGGEELLLCDGFLTFPKNNFLMQNHKI